MLQQLWIDCDCLIIVTDCSTIPPLVANSASATYNSVGTFSCANGTLYYSNGTQPTSTQTICLATAEWSGQDGLECRQGGFVISKRNKTIQDYKIIQFKWYGAKLFALYHLLKAISLMDCRLALRFTIIVMIIIKLVSWDKLS